MTQPQYRLLRAWVLGGIDAIGKHSTRTVDALIASGHVDANGPTQKGKRYVDERERADRIPAGITDASALNRVRFPYGWGIGGPVHGGPES